MPDRLEGNLHIVSRADALDAEQLLDMTHSTPWELYKRRLLAVLEGYRKVCETETESTMVLRAQGAAAAIRAVLQLPENLVEEVRSRIAASKPALMNREKFFRP